MQPEQAGTPMFRPVILFRPIVGKLSKFEWASHQKRWFGKWHTWLGILAGAVIAVIGLTGSILVFRAEIEQALNPGIGTVALQAAKPMDLLEMSRVVKTRYPEIEISAFSHSILDFEKEPNKVYRLSAKDRETTLYLDPYTGDTYTMPAVPRGEEFMDFVTEIHHELLIEGYGRYITGAASFILVILLISGLRLWLPQKLSQLKNALKIDFKAGFKRQNLDWHTSIGFYTSPVVLILALTGVFMAFSLYLKPAMSLLNGQPASKVKSFYSLKSAYRDNTPAIPVDRVLELALAVSPGTNLVGVSTPSDSLGTYVVTLIPKGKSGEADRQNVVLNQYSGEVLFHTERDWTQVSRAFSWIPALHYGTFGGLPTKILAFIGGLAPLALFITGFIVWWPRMKKSGSTQATARKTSPVKEDEIKVSHTRYFLTTLYKGTKYALWMAASAAAAGVFYGLLSGAILQPASFALMSAAALIALNFTVSVLVFLPNIVLAPFGKARRALTRYFALSLGVVIVFTVVFHVVTFALHFLT